jgi:hypothetical protein
MVSPLCLLLLVLGGYIVNLCVCYSYRLIEKLTAFLQLQEFNLPNVTVDSTPTYFFEMDPRPHQKIL